MYMALCDEKLCIRVQSALDIYGRLNTCRWCVSCPSFPSILLEGEKHKWRVRGSEMWVMATSREAGCQKAEQQIQESETGEQSPESFMSYTPLHMFLMVSY